MWRSLSLLAVLPLLFAAAPSRAADLTILVTPMTQVISAQPGVPYTGVLTVISQLPAGEKPENLAPTRIKVYASDWTLTRKGEAEFARAGTLAGSCSNWLQVNPVELELRPGNTREVRFTLNIPADAQGTYRTVLMFETAPVPAKLDGRNLVSVAGRIGSTMHVQVGPQSKRARLTEFKVTPERATLTVENSGTSHVRVKGLVKFENASGELIQQLELSGGTVLPGEQRFRDFELAVPKTLPAGTYRVTTLLDYGGEVLLGARTHVTIP